MNPIKLVFAVILLFQGVSSLAQMPPHTRGTICRTEHFWCWAETPGLAGSGCACPTAYGKAQGLLDPSESQWADYMRTKNLITCEVVRENEVQCGGVSYIHTGTLSESSPPATAR